MGCLPFYTKTFSYRPKDRTNCKSRVLDRAMDGIGTSLTSCRESWRGRQAADLGSGSLDVGRAVARAVAGHALAEEGDREPARGPEGLHPARGLGVAVALVEWHRVDGRAGAQLVEAGLGGARLHRAQQVAADA